MKEYYFHNGKSEEGPFTLDQLNDKNLQRDTKIWFEGLNNWVPAREVEELNHLIINKQKPPPLKIQDDKTDNFKSKPSHVPEVAIVDIPKNRKWLKYLLIAGISLLIIFLISTLGNYFSSKNSQIEYLQAQVDTQTQKIQTKAEEEEKKESERKRINAEITAKNMNFRNNWDTYITVDHSEPSVNYALGGIGEFSVMVSNQTTYLLDQVDIYVEYIRKNGDLAQERTVTIFNVPAGSIEVGIAPSSANGVKVNCTISKVVSKKMHFCYPSFSGNQDDMYFCK